MSPVQNLLHAASLGLYLKNGFMFVFLEHLKYFLSYKICILSRLLVLLSRKLPTQVCIHLSTNFSCVGCMVILICAVNHNPVFETDRLCVYAKQQSKLACIHSYFNVTCTLASIVFQVKHDRTAMLIHLK